MNTETFDTFTLTPEMAALAEQLEKDGELPAIQTLDELGAEDEETQVTETVQ